MSSKWINKSLFNSYVEKKEKEKVDKTSVRNDVAWRTPEKGTADNPKIYEGRFVPDPKGIFTKKYYYHMYQSNGKWYFQLCEKTFNFDNWCPWCSVASKLYQGTSSDKKAAGNYKRKVRHVGNWYVVDDPRDNEIDDENRKSNGKVKIYEFPDQVESKINGEIFDRRRGAGSRIFDPGEDGLNFILKVKSTKQDKDKRIFPDYSDSKFSSLSSSLGSEKEIKDIMTSTYDLEAYLIDMKSDDDVTKELLKNEMLWDIISGEWVRYKNDGEDENKNENEKHDDIPSSLEESPEKQKDQKQETVDVDEKEDELSDAEILAELDSL